VAQVVRAKDKSTERRNRDEQTAARIHRIETELIPAVATKGQAVRAKTLAEYMKQSKVPGLSVAVIDGGRIAWARSYGVVATGGSQRVSPETLFQAASISKPVAAMAALRLVQQGKIDLDEDVNDRLKTWKVPNSDQTREHHVTLRRLLSHSAGLTVHGFPGYAQGVRVPTLVQVLDGAAPANTAPVRVDLVPGTKFRYSGGGYCVVQQLIKDLTSKPFDQFLQETALDPLGMTRSTYRQPLPHDLAAAAATAHRADGTPIKGRWHTYPERAAAGLWTTPTDLARFAIELADARAGRSNRVLSQATVRQMLTPELGGYGLGLAVKGMGKRFQFAHGGSNAGFRCMLIAFPETGQGAAVMTNSDNGDVVITAVVRAIAKEYGWPADNLVRESNDEATAVDALVWVVRNGFRTPEGDQAVQKIAEHYLRSDRIAAVCHALGARGPEGEALLERILEGNPNPGIRGRACLALAFGRSLQLREEIRTQGKLPEDRPESAEPKDLELQKRKSKTAALAAEIEHWLRQVLDEFPGVLLEQDITDNFGLLAENLGPTAGQILRRIAEMHPQSETRWEADCGLALQQMQIASLVADLRSVASVPPGSKKCAGSGVAAACVSGGETRLIAVDSKALVREIERRLQTIADRVNDVKQPGICCFHLVMDSPTLSQYHAGTETLLRCVAERHPNSRFRAAARHSLAIYLAGIADLSRTIDSDRAHWVDRLGEVRVEQIRRLDPDRLIHESRSLAEEVEKGVRSH